MNLRLLVTLPLFVATAASAQGAAGVSDERVSLPGAPGSLDGLGSNAMSEGNQGALTYDVEIEVPPGFSQLTPDLALSYSSSGGSGLLGAGWSMDGFFLERMTSKGLQTYGLDDRFVADGSTELVRVAQAGAEATYRARFEGGFIRYTWKNRGAGEGGSWTAEYPDGRVAHYGAEPNGTAVTQAQVIAPGSSPARIFRWHLVAMVDPFGHELRFSWTKGTSGFPLLDRIDYVFEAGTPRHSVRFTYEARPDLLSDARPGFELVLDQRLKDVRVLSGAEVIRAYVVQYEPQTASDGATRLSKVTRFGRNNVQHPVTFSFEYTQTLGAICGAGCDKPFVRDMGTIAGVDFGSGRATLVDINGDALPDVLASDLMGRHTFYYARLESDGRASFSPTPVTSQKTAAGGFLIGDARTQLLDLDGNGFVDLAQAATSSVLCNDGSGDWVDAAACTSGAINLPSAAMTEDAEPTQADPRYIRFFDYDADRRIDWLRTFAGASGTEVLANTPSGFQTVAVTNIGATFDEDALQLADMNGDGLQDPVQLIVAGTAVQAQYKLNFGRGTWSAWKTITLTGLDVSQASVAELQDVNGDGLADVVAVTGSEVRLALNRNGERFDPVRVLTSAELATGSTMPTRVTGTTVVFADMNGNGSDDVVWIQQTGKVEYLELFPVRPNLITRIDNGLGGVQLISYGTSVAEQARDAQTAPWPNRVPHAAVVVKTLTSFVTLTATATSGLRELVGIDYHAGFYDGVEKQFRGYERVTRTLSADMSRDALEPSVIELEFDVGKTDPLLAGAEVKKSTYSTATGSRVLLVEERTLWAACPAAQATPQVAFRCARADTRVQVEREPQNAVTTRVERDFDGYGNPVAVRQLGVVNLGTPENPSACGACLASGLFGAPCGMTCERDEQFITHELVVPGADTQGRWLLGLVKRTTSSAVDGMPGDETLTYYDGPDFEGLPLGQATAGAVSRVMARVGPGPNDLVPFKRARHDLHGNAVETLEARGSPASMGLGRRRYTYDSTGLNLLRSELMLSEAAGAVSALRTDYVWDTTWEQPSQASNAYPVVNGMAAATPQLTRYRFDDHGRVVRVLDPGDTDATASMELRYELADPASRVLILQRSSAAGSQDLQTARCFDGRGRVFQTREKLTDTSWQVNGFVEFDARGAVARRYQPYLSPSGACEPAPPTGGRFSTFRYDAFGRGLSEVEPDGATRRRAYGPLEVRIYDEHDTDAAASFTETPLVRVEDGLGRAVEVHRLLERNGAPAVTRVEYDRLGNLATVRDAAGNLHAQTWLPTGRLAAVTDPNAGTVRFEYDDDGNQVRRIDARLKSTRTAFDGADRVIARWDEADEAGTKETWAYDLLPGCTECTNAGGELVEETWPGALGGSRRHGYDAKGNLVYSERRVGAKALVTRRRYDQADREVSVTWPGGLTLDKRYDGASRLTALPGVVEQLDYDPQGDLRRLVYTNGVATDLTYDARRRVATLKTVAPGAQPLLDLAYTWNQRGDLTALTDGARAGRARHAGAFTYDGYGRLTAAALGREGPDEVLSFGYDLLDNLTSKTSSLGAESRAHAGAYEHDPLKKNAVVKAGELTYAYDDAGELTRRGDVTLGRDSQGRIVSASRGGQATATYAHAGAERVAKVEDGWTTLYVDGDFEVRDGIASGYARSGAMRVGRLQTGALAAVLYSDLAPANGTPPQLTPAPDGAIDVADAWLAQAAGLQLVQLSGAPQPSAVDDLLRSAARRLLMTDATALHADHLGSLVLATDATGAVRGEQSFYPSGELRSRAGYVDPYGFTGQERDVATGLTHFQYRDLDTFSGRWDGPDPSFEEIAEPELLLVGQVTGGYAYTSNRLMNASDPTGLRWRLSLKRFGQSVRSGWRSLKAYKQKNNLTAANVARSAYAKATKTRDKKVARWEDGLMIISVVLKAAQFGISEQADQDEADAAAEADKGTPAGDAEAAKQQASADELETHAKNLSYASMAISAIQVAKFTKTHAPKLYKLAMGKVSRGGKAQAPKKARQPKGPFEGAAPVSVPAGAPANAGGSGMSPIRPPVQTSSPLEKNR